MLTLNSSTSCCGRIERVLGLDDPGVRRIQRGGGAVELLPPLIEQFLSRMSALQQGLVRSSCCCANVNWVCCCAWRRASSSARWAPST